MANSLTEACAGPYLRDLLDQPRAMEQTVTRLDRVPELSILRAQLERGDRRRIILTAMGGSYQLLFPLYYRLIQVGFNAIMLETSELIYSAPRLLDSENVLLMVSQSGTSAEIVHVLESKKPGAYVVGVTNTPGSPLATTSDLTLMTYAGEEASVSCKTSITGLAALEWLGEHLCGGNLEHLRQELGAAAPAIADYLQHWPEHVAALHAQLNGIRSFFAVGRGRSLAAANLGAMIQKETARVHGEGLSSAAFRHGAIEMLSEEVFVMVLDGDADVSARNRQLFRDILAYGGRAALVGWQETSGPFLLPKGPERIRPILELLPAQMTSLALAALRGRQPGVFERLTKITTVE